MSVVKSERGESNVQFLYNARELEKHTITKCVNFPKRYSFYVGIPLANLATEVHVECKKANSIYPSNQDEAMMRRAHLLEAKASLMAMVSQIELACELFGIEEKKLKHWMAMVNEESRLISGVLSADKKRFKDLP